MSTENSATQSPPWEVPPKPPQELERPSTALLQALIAMQQDLRPALKDSENPHFKSTYADLDSCWEACKDALKAHGFFWTCRLVLTSGEPLARTTLWHRSGESISTDMPLLNQQRTMQGLGSALTYARRYSLMALVGLCPKEDDDANAASNVVNANKRPEQRAKPQATTATKPPPAAKAATAQPATQNKAKPGGAAPPARQSPKDPATEPQIKRMFAMAKEAGYVAQDGKVDLHALKSMLYDLFGDDVIDDDGKDVTTKKLTWAMMDRVYKELAGGGGK